MLGKKTNIRDSLRTGGRYHCFITDMKILSKVLSVRIKSVLSFLIFSNQMADVKNKFISKSGRFISAILRIANTQALESFLVTIDIEKGFDSLITTNSCKFFKNLDRDRFC